MSGLWTETRLADPRVEGGGSVSEEVGEGGALEELGYFEGTPLWRL